MSSMYGSTGSMPRSTSTGNKAPPGQKMGQMQQFTPEQMQLFQSMFGHVGPESYTGRLARGDESLFGEMEAPALRQFSGMQGQLASRFSGMGSGARKSSGFQNTMNAASSDFAQDLQSKRQGLQRQAIMDLMGMSKDLLGQQPYQQYTYDKEEPWWKKLLGGLGNLGGQFGGNFAAQAGNKAVNKFF